MRISLFNNSPFELVKQIALGMFISMSLYALVFVAVSFVSVIQHQ